MKKLLLTSAGFTSIKIVEEFKKLIEKDLSCVKVLFVPTAFRLISWRAIAYVSQSKADLVELGVREENITDYNLDFTITTEELNKFNMVYVGGGNTFYLLHKIKERSFGKMLKPAVENGLVYVGVSAGSIVAGPTIETAGPFDENDIGITDLRGMDFTDTIIIPHYSVKRKKIVEHFSRTMDRKILAIKDSQAVVVINEETKII